MKEEKKFKHKKSKKRKSRSRSRSYSRSKERSIPRSDSYSINYKSKNYEFDRRLEKLRKKTYKNKKERSDSPFTANIKIKMPNKGLLAKMLNKNISQNTKMDNDEINRASDNLKKYDPNKKV